LTEPKPTLENPGQCAVCNRTRSASIAVTASGSVVTLFCPEHAKHRSEPAGVMLTVCLNGDGTFSTWADGATVFGEADLRQMMRALLDVSVARGQRAKAALRAEVGPWRLVVTPDGLVAPRAPGELADLNGTPWPMVKARLRKSKLIRKCVQCREPLADGADVLRADPAAGARTNGGHRIWAGWSSHDVSHCIVCMGCVDLVRHDHEHAGQVAADIFGEMLKAKAKP
jgi:hypothetical protein